MYYLTAIALIAEEKILEAQREGAFDNLPGSGKPLPPDDEDALLPPETRMSCKILRNSGYLAENDRLEIKAENREERARHRRLRRFAVMYGRMKKAGGGMVRSGSSARPDASGLDAALETAVNKTLEDSPYFDKILTKF